MRSILERFIPGRIAGAIQDWEMRRALQEDRQQMQEPHKPDDEITTEPEIGDKDHPSLVLVNSPTILGNVDDRLASQLTALRDRIYGELGGAFEEIGCHVEHLDNRESPATVINSSYAILMNSVFLGKLAPEAYETLATANSTEDEESEEYIKRREQLRDSLPEIDPLIWDIGRVICKKMKITPSANHPNFINMVFIDDSEGYIGKLPYQYKKLLDWMLMTKLGSYKVLLVPYQLQEGEARVEKVIVGTLEGGHPDMQTVRIADALIPFGGAKAVGEARALKDEMAVREGRLKTEEQIEDDAVLEERKKNHIWLKGDELKVADYLIKFGHFLKKFKLISPAVSVYDLIKNRRLGNKIKRLSNNSRQQEGAFMVWDQYLKRFILTASGKFGAVKTDLTYKDLLMVMSDLKIEDLVWFLPIQGVNIDIKPSVEAEEFTSPLMQLVFEELTHEGEDLSNNRMNSIYLRKVAGGYIEDNVNGELAPAIRAVIHLHRGVDEETLSKDDVIVVPTDIVKYPAVGCGVDRMREMSEYAMRMALKLWNDGGRKAKAAVFYVPNHGYNVFVFHTPGKNRIIPEDPTELFQDLVTEKKLNFFYEVPQRAPERVMAAA